MVPVALSLSGKKVSAVMSDARARLRDGTALAASLAVDRLAVSPSLVVRGAEAGRPVTLQTWGALTAIKRFLVARALRLGVRVGFGLSQRRRGAEPVGGLALPLRGYSVRGTGWKRSSPSFTVLLETRGLHPTFERERHVADRDSLAEMGDEEKPSVARGTYSLPWELAHHSPGQLFAPDELRGACHEAGGDSGGEGARKAGRAAQRRRWWRCGAGWTYQPGKRPMSCATRASVT